MVAGFGLLCRASNDSRWLLVMPIVVFVLLIGAADVAWGLLVLDSGGDA